jgi:hypothetical protein
VTLCANLFDDDGIPPLVRATTPPIQKQTGVADRLGARLRGEPTRRAAHRLETGTSNTGGGGWQCGYRTLSGSAARQASGHAQRAVALARRVQ